MSKTQLKVVTANQDVLLGNIRGEVGEIITTWVLLRHFMGICGDRRTGDIDRDMQDRELQLFELLCDKLRDEAISRLSELAEKKIGQLTFHFASQKLGKFADDVADFEKYIVTSKIRKRRNENISHKKAPGQWHEHHDTRIGYTEILKAIARCLRLIKKIDRSVLGPSAPFLWKEARLRRYNYMSPPRAGYMLLPYLNLSPRERIQITMAESAEGREVWTPMPTVANGQTVTVFACKPWGVLHLGDHLLALERYPLISLQNISAEGSPPTAGDNSGSPTSPEETI